MTARTPVTYTIKVELGAGSTRDEAFEEAQAIAAAQGLTMKNTVIRADPYHRGTWLLRFQSR